MGEISDETDPAGGAIRRLANGDWLVRGHVAVTDLEDYGLELPVDTDAYNSVGGFVFAELGRLPRRGDSISANGYTLRVESVRQNRIEAVRIKPARAAASRSFARQVSQHSLHMPSTQQPGEPLQRHSLQESRWLRGEMKPAGAARVFARVLCPSIRAARTRAQCAC